MCDAYYTLNTTQFYKLLTNVSVSYLTSKMEEQNLPKIKAEFVNLRRISLPIELEIKDWKAFERIYRPKGTPQEARPTDNIAVRTDEEKGLFEKRF